MRYANNRRRRSGNVLILTMLMMIAMFAAVAFSVDLGYLFVVQSEVQRTADSAALASAWKLCDETVLTGSIDPLEAVVEAKASADQYAALNAIAGKAPALSWSDVDMGYLQADGETISLNPTAYVAASVNVRRDADQNGRVPLFFSRVLGINDSGVSSEATAVFINKIGGFKAPSNGENLGILPFALDKQTWDNRASAGSVDKYSCKQDLDTGEWVVTEEPDGIPEVNLFPQSSIAEEFDAPGNRGTVDIGSDNNSTNDIARQVLYGVSPADLAHHGGKLAFNECGEILLNGDTGISAGVKDELNSIKGQPRIVPLFTDVNGNGNNAQYTIVRFVGVRILNIKLTGKMSGKEVIIQPAKCQTKGAIASESDTSDFVYSAVWLVK